MSVEVASVLGMFGVVSFLYWWQRDLQNSNMWSVGLKYLLRGTTFGLLIPLLGYVINLQTDSGLQEIVTVPHSVVIWTFWIVLAFLMLNFTFDLLRPKAWPGVRR